MLLFFNLYSPERHCSRKQSKKLNTFRENKTGISCQLSARQMIHVNCQTLFSLKNTKKSFAAVVISR